MFLGDISLVISVNRGASDWEIFSDDCGLEFKSDSGSSVEVNQEKKDSEGQECYDAYQKI
jgi:hypothetical protein